MRLLKPFRAENRERLIRRTVLKFRRHAPELDRLIRRTRAGLEPRYLRTRPARPIVVDIGKYPYMGLGASIGWLHAAYIAREVLGVPLFVTRPGSWPFGGRRPECGLDRFIQFPLAELRAAADVPPDATPFEVGSWANLRRWGYFDDLDWPYCLFGKKPAEYSSLEDFRRSVFRRTYQLTDDAQRQVTEMLGFMPGQHVAWHVRRGDKTSGPYREDLPVPLSVYAHETSRLYEMHPQAPRQIVVCSDSDEIIPEARIAARAIPGGAEIVHDAREKRWDGYSALHRSGKITDLDAMVQEVLTAQKVLQILRSAHTLIGCNSSLLFRVASLLRPDASGVISLSENKAWKKYYPI